MLSTGDSVEAGTYVCENCQEAYEHKEVQKPLPPCPNCGIWTLYRKVEK